MEEQEVYVGPMWYDYEVKDKMGEFIKANPYFSDQESIKYVKFLRKKLRFPYREFRVIPKRVGLGVAKQG